MQNLSFNLKLWHIIALSITLRCGLLWFTSLAELCRTFEAFSTPISSWKRYEEGMFLYLREIDPYSNSLFHQSPLFLPLFSILPSGIYPYLFILFDAITGYTFAKIYQLHSTVEIFSWNKEEKSLSTAFTSLWIAVLYLFNPMTIVSCLSMEYGIFERMWIVSAIYYGIQGDLVLSSLFLSITSESGAYPLLLAPFVAMLIRKKTKVSALSTIPSMFILILTWHILFHLFYNQIIGLDSFSILKGTFWTVLTVPVITPNLGIFWYFLLEVFLEFRSFFVIVFQCHVAVYVVPILLRFGKDLPLFSIGMYLGILASLKSYPTVGDYALWITFIFFYTNTWKYYRYTFISVGFFVSFFFLTPIMYILWIHFEAGNSNFFYGLNLLLLIASNLLLSDYVSGVLLHSFYHEKQKLDGTGDDTMLLYSTMG